MTGIIKKVIEKKHFGFIRAKNKEYFFHADDLADRSGGSWTELCRDYEAATLNKIDIEVSFDQISTPKGLRASNVERV